MSISLLERPDGLEIERWREEYNYRIRKNNLKVYVIGLEDLIIDRLNACICKE